MKPNTQNRLYHVTLNTSHETLGHAILQQWPSPWNDLFDSMASGGPLPEPLSAYYSQVSKSNGSALFTLHKNGSPIIECMVCWELADHDTAWKRTVEFYAELYSNGLISGTPPDKLNQPRYLPWLAVTILDGIRLHTDALYWAGDWERVMAWSIIKNSQVGEKEPQPEHPETSVDDRHDNSMIVVHNNGQLVQQTNYFNSANARNGLIYTTVNDKCFRFLIPPSCQPIDSNGAQYVIVNLTDDKQKYIFVFEDHSKQPYQLMTPTSATDRIAPSSESGRTDLRVIGYDQQLKILFDLPGRFRVIAADANPAQPWGTKAPQPNHADPEYHLGEIAGRRYHSPLPPELEQWYRYTGDGGHSIKVLLRPFYKTGMSATSIYRNLVPAPVKTVLRGYTTLETHTKAGKIVIIDAELKTDFEFDPHVTKPIYCSTLGLVCNSGDIEY